MVLVGEIDLLKSRALFTNLSRCNRGSPQIELHAIGELADLKSLRQTQDRFQPGTSLRVGDRIIPFRIGAPFLHPLHNKLQGKSVLLRKGEPRRYLSSASSLTGVLFSLSG